MLRPLTALWPRQLGNQCLLMLGFGVLLGLWAPTAATALRPLGLAFLQAYQIVVMPFLICELIVGFGGLGSGSLRRLLRGGVLALLGVWVLGSLPVVFLPQFLPPLTYSGFFHAGLFQQPQSADLLRTYLPDNIFGALAADNFPAVVLFSAVLGILLQGMENRQELLRVLEVARQLFRRLNSLMARTVPYGILALSAVTFATLDWTQLVKIQAFMLLCLITFVVLSVLLTGLVLALTPLSAAGLWRIVRGPLALTASSSNLLIALPLLVESLRQELALLPSQAGRSEVLAAELAPLVSLGYSVPTLGQVATLIFLPFAAWYVDRPMGTGAIGRMLLTGIPASVSGIKSVVRQELQRQELPLPLLKLVYLNGDWLYRFEKVLSLEGLVLLALLVSFGSVQALRLRPLRLIAALALPLVLAGAMGTGARATLATSLKGTYRNDRRLLELQPLLQGAPPEVLVDPRSEPVTLQAIRQRGVLRAGVRSDGMPWAYRNALGRPVGFDIDLAEGLARSLGVRLQIVEQPLAKLERLLDRGRIDLALGGIQSSPQRAIRHHVSLGYESVHLALVVPDGKVGLIQNLSQRPLGRPLRMAVADPQLITASLSDRIAAELGVPPGRSGLQLVPIASKEQFFTPAGQRGFDALLTTAEGGSAWAVLYPRTTLLASFGDRLNGELVMLVAGGDPNLQAYLDAWISQEQGRGLMGSLFQHWIDLDADPRRRDGGRNQDLGL
jgi:hypothetical protein